MRAEIRRHLTIAAITAAISTLPACGGARATRPSDNSAAASPAAMLVGLGTKPIGGDELRRVLADMPKGGDLHNHLSGAVYAESYVRWAAEDGGCIARATLASVHPPCSQSEGRILAADVLHDSVLYRSVLDAWSMLDWKPGGAESGADHFFATFGKFSVASPDSRLGDMLAEATTRAAAQHVSYMELMMNPEAASFSRLASRLGWNPDFARMRVRLDSAGIRDSLRAASRVVDRAEARRMEAQRCGTPQADAGCDVVVRYIYQVIRSRAPEQVFAQILAGYEWQGIDPRFVGFNLVAPEHGAVAVKDFSLHMSMIDMLRPDFPAARVTLHAGELAPGMVPPDALRSHIRQSVEIGHARRIGHGVDVLGEDGSDAVLREMADRRILVEIALTSNDVILGVRGAAHPLAAYLRAGVPVALATDDAGVSRSDMTREFARAVADQRLDYPTLKRMVRNSLEYAFVDGRSLWTDRDSFAPVMACAGTLEGSDCRAYVAGNAKARLQWNLERSLAAFEKAHGM